MSAAPKCASCNRPARLTRGIEIYPHRKDLADKPIWKCDGCGGRVGCHPGTTKALGTPAGPELRRARGLLHDDMLDPLWKGKKGQSRSLVYAYLGAHMNLPAEQVHIGMFNIVQCRDAWKILNGTTYSQIARWAEESRPARHDKGQAA